MLFVIGHCNGLQSTVIHSWPGNFQGRFDSPLSKPIRYGWTVTLTFDKAVSNLQVMCRFDLFKNKNYFEVNMYIL